MKKQFYLVSLLFIVVVIRSQNLERREKNCHYSCKSCFSDSYTDCYECAYGRVMVPTQRLKVDLMKLRTSLDTTSNPFEEKIQHYRGYCSCPSQASKLKQYFVFNKVIFSGSLSAASLSELDLKTSYDIGADGCRKYQASDDIIYIGTLVTTFALLVFSILELFIRRSISPLLMALTLFQNIGVFSLYEGFKMGFQRDLFGFFYQFCFAYLFAPSTTESFALKNSIPELMNQNTEQFLQLETGSFSKLTYLLLIFQVIVFLGIVACKLYQVKLEKLLPQSDVENSEKNSKNSPKLTQENVQQRNSFNQMQPSQLQENAAPVQMLDTLGPSQESSDRKYMQGGAVNNQNQQNQSNYLAVGDTMKTHDQSQSKYGNLDEQTELKGNVNLNSSPGNSRIQNNKERNSEQGSDKQFSQEEEEVSETQKKIHLIEGVKQIIIKIFIIITLLTVQEITIYLGLQMTVSVNFLDIFFILVWISMQLVLTPLFMYVNYNILKQDAGYDRVKFDSLLLFHKNQNGNNGISVNSKTNTIDINKEAKLSQLQMQNLAKQSKFSIKIKENFNFIVYGQKIVLGIFLIASSSSGFLQAIFAALIQFSLLVFISFYKPFKQLESYFNFRFAFIQGMIVLSNLLFIAQFKVLEGNQLHIAKLMQMIPIGSSSILIIIIILGNLSQIMLNKARIPKPKKVKKDQIVPLCQSDHSCVEKDSAPELQEDEKDEDQVQEQEQQIIKEDIENPVLNVEDKQEQKNSSRQQEQEEKQVQNKKQSTDNSSMRGTKGRFKIQKQKKLQVTREQSQDPNYLKYLNNRFHMYFENTVKKSLYQQALQQEKIIKRHQEKKDKLKDFYFF